MFRRCLLIAVVSCVVLLLVGQVHADAPSAASTGTPYFYARSHDIYPLCYKTPDVAALRYGGKWSYVTVRPKTGSSLTGRAELSWPWRFPSGQ